MKTAQNPGIDYRIRPNAFSRHRMQKPRILNHQSPEHFWSSRPVSKKSCKSSRKPSRNPRLDLYLEAQGTWLRSGSWVIRQVGSRVTNPNSSTYNRYYYKLHTKSTDPSRNLHTFKLNTQIPPHGTLNSHGPKPKSENSRFQTSLNLN